ncbi:hypothetical protein ACET3Z_031521 [Daucus carota]
MIEIKSGNLEQDEEVDRAVLWKKARKVQSDDEEADKDLKKIFKKIDTLLELKKNGEFTPSRSNDVLTTALETPEGSGRVRAVGSFVNPKVYFQLPRQRRVDITKSELLKRDKLMTEELEKAKQNLINKKTEMMSEIDKLKKMITAGVV